MSTELSKTLAYNDWTGDTISAKLVIMIRGMPKDSYDVLIAKIEKMVDEYDSHEDTKRSKNYYRNTK